MTVAPLSVEVSGDPVACRVGAHAFARTGETVAETVRCLRSLRAKLDDTVFEGATSGAFATAVDRLITPAADQAEHLAALSRGLHALADALQAAQRAMAAVVAMGNVHGLVVDGTLRTPDAQPAGAPAWQAWSDCQQAITTVHQGQDEAQQRWRRVLRHHDVALPVRPAPAPPGSPLTVPVIGVGIPRGPVRVPTSIRPGPRHPGDGDGPGKKGSGKHGQAWAITHHTQGPSAVPTAPVAGPFIPRWIQVTFLDGVDLPPQAPPAHWARVAKQLRGEIFTFLGGRVSRAELDGLDLPHLFEVVSQTPGPDAGVGVVSVE